MYILLTLLKIISERPDFFKNFAATWAGMDPEPEGSTCKRNSNFYHIQVVSLMLKVKHSVRQI